jgi:hypothetical protein
MGKRRSQFAELVAVLLSKKESAEGRVFSVIFVSQQEVNNEWLDGNICLGIRIKSWSFSMHFFLV